MSSPLSSAKRKKEPVGEVSPPPLRRKLQSTTTQTAVASFFTPQSKKAPENLTWSTRGPNEAAPRTLLVGTYKPANPSNPIQNFNSTANKRRKIAAFDFDSTLVQTSSGKKFGGDIQDWKWWHMSVPGILRKLSIEDGFIIVVISNQGGIVLKPDSKVPRAHQTRLGSFKSKVSTVFNQLDLPINIYAATERDIYRKPRMGMWKELLEDYDIHNPGDLDLDESIFVGDAGGRDAFGGKSKDFACSDRDFAENAGIKFYTPEEFFLQEAPRPFTRTFKPSKYLSDPDVTEVPEAYARKNNQDIILFCGSPGAGKSSFYWKQLEPLKYVRVNQDILKTRDRCIKVAGQYLEEGKSVVIDNTNPDCEVRSRWVALATKHAVPIRCVLFTAESQLCEHNDAVRAFNDVMNPEKRAMLPSLAFKGFASRYQRPELSEGFQDITEVNFKFDGSDAERQIWNQHWG